jgi:hypothetical protein
VFNNGKDNGFIIVSGDDKAAPVLGYSDEGSFDANDIPDGMRYWLECYAEQMQYLRSHPESAYVAPRSRPNVFITPLLTCKWNQNSPYNMDCPEVKDSEGVKMYAPTGCAATAMAQLMYYHKLETKTQTIPAYTTEKEKIQLEALPPYAFQWSKMQNEYQEGDKSEGAKEVAKLMRYCGQAAQMDYDVYSGAETSGDYLHRYFGFKPSFTDKYYVEHMSGWEDLIYDELAAGRPVIYSGKKMTGFLKFSGHVYVVDGYDGDGLFHINWGWNGNDDGFFVLTSANDYDIAMLQMAVIGLEPEGNATSIEALPAAARLQDVTSQPLFDLQGRCIMNHQQKKGLRIVDGRLVYIK